VSCQDTQRTHPHRRASSTTRSRSRTAALTAVRSNRSSPTDFTESSLILDVLTGRVTDATGAPLAGRCSTSGMRMPTGAARVPSDLPECIFGSKVVADDDGRYAKRTSDGSL